MRLKCFKYSVCVLGLLLGFTAYGQQQPQFTQYMYNTISINPAYAGSRETLSIVGLHRSQWAGFSGGPSTQTLSLHTPLKNERIGLGLSFINDQLGYENFSYLYADFSYSISTGERTRLSFGLKAGFTGFSIDGRIFNDQIDIDDPVISGLQDRWDPNVGAGLLWHSRAFYLGLSAPRLINNNYTNADGLKALERVGYYFTGGVVLPMSKEVMFKPAFMLKATNGAPMALDLTANFFIFQRLWLGAGYRFNNSAGAVGGLVDFQVTKEWRIGYTYEYATSDIRQYTNGTHEVLIMFEVFNERKRVRSPRFF